MKYLLLLCQTKIIVYSSVDADVSTSCTVFYEKLCLIFALQDIKAASLRTLTSIVHLERTPKLSNIIDCTGTASYHGFLPVLVRNCIQAMIGKNVVKMFKSALSCTGNWDN